MKRILTALLFCLAALPVMALDLGDTAPEITPETWITGDPVDPTKIDDKTFYLVEVWSVTCPPCVDSIPVMNAVQKKYADQGLKIVSFTTDSEQDVRVFLSKHPMEYSSFIDKEGGSMVNYMAADNRTTIPHAFLFDKSGALVWIGNPLDNLEKRVQQVLSGQLNRERAIAVRDAKEKLQKAFGEQNVEDMVSSLEELQKMEPDNGQYYQVQYRIMTDLGAGGEKEVQDLFKRWYAGMQDSAEGLVFLSMIAMDQGPPALRNPELALAAAKRSFELDSDVKLQAGLNLAETYKGIGRIDLALKTLDAIDGLTRDSDEADMLGTIKDFYGRIQALGKNPDAAYKP